MPDQYGHNMLHSSPSEKLLHARVDYYTRLCYRILDDLFGWGFLPVFLQHHYEKNHTLRNCGHEVAELGVQ